MATELGRTVQPIKQRGNSLHVTLPKHLLRLLGWNKGDVLHFTKINRSMVLTRVDLPKVELLSKESQEDNRPRS